TLHQKPRRILVPQDGSPLARAILPLARGFARFHRAGLALLHVRARSHSRRTGSSIEKATRTLEHRAAAMRAGGIPVRALVEEGDAAEEILKACRAGDLLVMTAHGYGGLKRLVLGSVAEKVIHQAPVPVLVHKKPANYRRLPHDVANLELFDS